MQTLVTLLSNREKCNGFSSCKWRDNPHLFIALAIALLFGSAQVNPGPAKSDTNQAIRMPARKR